MNNGIGREVLKMELILTFFEFISQLPVWGEIWTLGVVRSERSDRKRGVQIAFGVEFIILLLICVAGLWLDLSLEKAPVSFIWLAAFGAIAAQFLIGVLLFAVCRMRKQ